MVIYAIETQMLTDATTSGTGLTVCPCLTMLGLAFLHDIPPVQISVFAALHGWNWSREPSASAVEWKRGFEPRLPPRC